MKKVSKSSKSHSKNPSDTANDDNRAPKDKVFIKNNLIEGKYALTLNEQKMVLFLLTTIDKDDEDFWTYRTSVTDLGIQPQEVRITARRLMTRVLEIEEEDGLLMTHWFSSIKHIRNTPYIEFSFDPKLRPYLLKIKRAFTVVDLKYILPMKSSYSVRLYQLLKQYEGIGHREFFLDGNNGLREMLKLPKSYRYHDIKRKVLDPLIQDTMKSDLFIDYRPKEKQGKKVLSIEFKIEKVRHNLWSYRQKKIKEAQASETGIFLTNTKDRNTGKIIKLHLTRDGKFYNALDPNWTISLDRAKEIWEKLYEIEETTI